MPNPSPHRLTIVQLLGLGILSIAVGMWLIAETFPKQSALAVQAAESPSQEVSTEDPREEAFAKVEIIPKDVTVAPKQSGRELWEGHITHGFGRLVSSPTAKEVVFEYGVGDEKHRLTLPEDVSMEWREQYKAGRLGMCTNFDPEEYYENEPGLQNSGQRYYFKGGLLIASDLRPKTKNIFKPYYLSPEKFMEQIDQPVDVQLANKSE